MPIHSLDAIAQRLTDHEPAFIDVTNRTRQAAVAIVLHESEQRPEVLFIKRATVEGDPWSGHMAFPGGHMEGGDANLVEAAMRETEEEIGLDLTSSRLIGPLSHQRAAPRGRTIDMLVAPYVFALESIPDLKLNHEVDEVVWGSFDAMYRGSNHDVEYRPVADTKVAFNGYRLADRHFVWGLTYRTLQTLFAAIDPAYEEPAEPA